MKILLFVLSVVVTSSITAQIEDLVQWSAELNEEQSAITLKAEMKGDWVIYSQHTDPEGPIPLEFEFEAVDGVEYVGPVEEITVPITKMSELFGVEVIKFEQSAEFSQAIKIKAKSGVIKGNVTFMTCDASRCLPPKTVPFEVKI